MKTLHQITYNSDTNSFQGEYSDAISHACDSALYASFLRQLNNSLHDDLGMKNYMKTVVSELFYGPSQVCLWITIIMMVFMFLPLFLVFFSVFIPLLSVVMIALLVCAGVILYKSYKLYPKIIHAPFFRAAATCIAWDAPDQWQLVPHVTVQDRVGLDRLVQKVQFRPHRVLFDSTLRAFATYHRKEFKVSICEYGQASLDLII
eukprot:gnl/Dysnectes_brevis/1254_a1401_2500.p1 GENE.gnl/Dysnectes_brevis/1254_a1401_2500~~gnl/Dysnectes_brevis/1254_a1401_2500.p1  ORF type:complete len:204 (-),score=48.15 gnl/Dysnectes_brevis/1254_a1401_2500:31-642(-)